MSTLVTVVLLSLSGPRPRSLPVMMAGVAAIGRAPRPTPRVAFNIRHPSAYFMFGSPVNSDLQFGSKFRI